MKRQLLLCGFYLGLLFMPVCAAHAEETAPGSSTLAATLISPVTSSIEAPRGVANLDLLKRVPVLEGGRIKPLDTYARNLLLRFSGRRSYQRQEAIFWLGRHLFVPESTFDDKIFLINHPDILAAINVPLEKHRRYSFEQLQAGFEKLHHLTTSALQLEEKSRTLVDQEIIRLYQNLELYLKLAQSFQFAIPNDSFTIASDETRTQLEFPLDRKVFSFLEIAQQVDRLQPVMEAHGGKEPEKWTDFERDSMRLLSKLYQWSTLYSDLPFTVIPSVDTKEERWFSPWDAIANQFTQEPIRREVAFWGEATAAYRTGSQVEFDLALRHFMESIHGRGGEAFQRAERFLGLEVWYNQAALFLWAKLAYAITLIAIFIFLWRLSGAVYQFSGLIFLAGFICHMLALGVRITILGRPPVSNLYETFIFVGAMSGLLGLVLEFFQRKGLGILTGAISGFILLIIASKYSAEGDTLKVLVAVLNSNFWLTVHVPTITAGYAACCVAGVLGHLYLLQIIWKPKETKAADGLYRSLLGMLGLGLTLSFFGTCLGGIWADQSWGRFWGWDPKENGALMIVLWTAMLLHMRIGGLVKSLGMAVGSILGMGVVVWAWFGVNLLSVGLHSYGFTSGALQGILAYVLFEVAFLAVSVPIAAKQLKGKV